MDFTYPYGVVSKNKLISFIVVSGFSQRVSDLFTNYQSILRIRLTEFIEFF